MDDFYFYASITILSNKYHLTNGKRYKLKLLVGDYNLYIFNDKKEWMMVPHQLNINYIYKQCKFKKDLRSVKKGFTTNLIISCDGKQFYWQGDFYKVRDYIIPC